MLNWLIKRGIQKHSSEFNNSVKSSFQNIRNDMDHISKWINHFKNKDEFHHGNFHSIIKKLENIDERLINLEQNNISESSIEPIYESTFESSEDDEKKWNSLTDAQRDLVRVISSICRERPNKWFSFREVAEENYPKKSYEQVKSTLVKYINLLEKIGYIKRKRSGNQVLVRVDEDIILPSENSKDIIFDMKSSNKTKKKKKNAKD